MLAARRFALAARPGAAHTSQRWRSSVVLLKDLPFALNTEDLLRGALEETLAGAPAPASLALKSRSSGRFNGRAQLVFADEAAAAAAFARRGEARGPLAEILRVVEAAAAVARGDPPDLMENDQYGILRSKKLPGLTWPEDLEGGPAPRAPEPKPEPAGPEGRWAETIVKIDRVQKVVRGARSCATARSSPSATSWAPAASPSARATAPGRRRASRRGPISAVDRHRDVALAHDVRGKHNNCTVDIYAVPRARAWSAARWGGPS
ncbi:hypothetical protein JL720_12894 [Aureococcus anophagefferens]|nr:hypothetical protein JL720_12894 [Aureococcus anophagefferens]